MPLASRQFQPRKQPIYVHYPMLMRNVESGPSNRNPLFFSAYGLNDAHYERFVYEKRPFVVLCGSVAAVSTNRFRGIRYANIPEPDSTVNG